MNIKNISVQLKSARNAGVITPDTQLRVLRRVGVINTQPVWAPLLALRKAIEADVLPALLKQRETDKEIFSEKYVEEKDEAQQTTSAIVTKPVLKGHEYTPAWWKEAEKRERAARKAGLLVD